MLGVVTLVPWRGGDRRREFNWNIVRPHLEAMGYPVILGDRAGPWSRAAAINQAAAAAGRWRVAIIADADTVVEPPVIREAVELARRTGGGVRPHDHLWRLTRQGSAVLKKHGPIAIHSRLTSGVAPGGGVLVVSRAAWDRIGGFNEAYVGWGHEDSAVSLELVAKASWDRLPGNAWHLWHPAPDRKTPQYRANRALLMRAQRENAMAIRKASKAAGWDVGKVL